MSGGLRGGCTEGNVQREAAQRLMWLGLRRVRDRRRGRVRERWPNRVAGLWAHRRFSTIQRDDRPKRKKEPWKRWWCCAQAWRTQGCEEAGEDGHERFPFVGGSEDEGPRAEFVQGIAGEGSSQNDNIVFATVPAVIFCAEELNRRGKTLVSSNLHRQDSKSLTIRRPASEEQECEQPDGLQHSASERPESSGIVGEYKDESKQIVTRK
jgi:hypothetical protein